MSYLEIVEQIERRLERRLHHPATRAMGEVLFQLRIVSPTGVREAIERLIAIHGVDLRVRGDKGTSSGPAA